MSDIVSRLEADFDVPTVYDHDLEGGADSNGQIRQVWGREALENSIKMWITSQSGEIIRSPQRGGYLFPWLTKPMTEVDTEDFAMSIRDGIDQDFTPALRIVRLEVNPNYSKRYWELYLEVQAQEFKTRVTISEKIKAQV